MNQQLSFAEISVWMAGATFGTNKARKTGSMNISNIDAANEWFQVLQTTKHAQTAVMLLTPGGHSSEVLNTHEKSDQVLFLVEGELTAEVAGEKRMMRKGDVCIVPAGTPHRFDNCGKERAVTLNVYSPPEYSPRTKG